MVDIFMRDLKFRYIIIFSVITLFVFSSETVTAGGESTFEITGDIMQILLPATGYLSTFYMDDEEGRNQFYKSFATNLGITYALKYTISKQRPENHGSHSFPSGHTSAAFQGAAFIHKRYGWKFGLPAYLGAAYVGWSRVEGESDKHDIWDVLAGAGIGIASSFYFAEPYKGVAITPVATDGFYGIFFTKTW